MSTNDKNDKKVWLLGKLSPNLMKTKLSTEKSVLKVLLYDILVNKRKLNESATELAVKVFQQWNSHKMPCMQKHKIAVKLKKLHHQYVLLKKKQ